MALLIFHQELGFLTHLGLQVCKQYLLWGLKYINMTYFGLFGAQGYTEQGNVRMKSMMFM